jgi:endonuclease-8
MPEGPSIVILREQVKNFSGKKVLSVTGNSKIDQDRLLNMKVITFKSWGKHFLICFNDFYLRIHFLLFGSYRINEKREMAPRLSLVFKNGEVNFYACSIKLMEGDPDDVYDWEKDIMSDKWNALKAERSLKKLGSRTMVCDALLNQEIFAGVGNIIKNEVLYRIRAHPESYISSLPSKKLKELIREARTYSLEFYKWKKIFQLRKHWLVYKNKICLRCNMPYKRTYLGKTNRLSFFCENCQVLYKKVS